MNTQQYTQKDKITQELVISSLTLAQELDCRHLLISECVRVNYSKLLIGIIHERQEKINGQVKTFYTLGQKPMLKLLELLNISLKKKSLKAFMKQVQQEFQQSNQDNLMKDTQKQQINPNINTPATFMFGDNHEVRTIEENGHIWFVANDIAKALGYSNPQKATRDHIDDEDRKKIVIQIKGVNESFTPQEINCVNESGMYSLVLFSRKKEARQFKHWVTAEVLPQIRQTGNYTKQPLNKQTALTYQHSIPISLIHRSTGVYIYSEQLAALLNQDHTDIVSQVEKIRFNKKLLLDTKHTLQITRYKDGYLLNIYALICLKLNHSENDIFTKMRILDSFTNMEKRLVLTMNKKLISIQDSLLFKGFNELNPIIANLMQLAEQYSPRFIQSQIKEIRPLLDNIKESLPNNKITSSGINVVISTLAILENHQDHQIRQQLQYLINRLSQLSGELSSRGDDIDKIMTMMKELGKFVDFSELEHIVPFSDQTLEDIDNQPQSNNQS